MRARVIARLVNHKQARELAVAFIGFLICAGVSAHGALRAIEAHPGTMATVAPPQTPADASAAAPAPGTTGTIALPALPVPAGTDPGDGSVLPARAFSMAAASTIDRARALTCLADAVYLVRTSTRLNSSH